MHSEAYEYILMKIYSTQKAESEKRHYENKLNVFRHEKQMLEKTIRENEEEKTYMRDQVM